MIRIEEGHYYRKQIASRSRIISWSHRSRFEKALALVGRHPNVRLLDYGCGDGTFLALVVEDFAEIVGADIAEGQIRDCRERFQNVPHTSFCLTSDLQDPRHDHTFRVVTCMETLEHCLDHVVERVLGDLWRLCHRDGRVVISVPIEIGPSFVPKYLIRKVAGWRGLSDYRHYETYSLSNAVRMMFATRSTALVRPAYGDPGAESHPHYGFNWRRLRTRIEERFTIERTDFTPLGFAGGWLSSQAWFVGRPR